MKRKKKLTKSAEKKKKLKEKKKKAEESLKEKPLPIPDFTIFGNPNDLMFYGDDEELYANPMPSSSR